MAGTEWQHHGQASASKMRSSIASVKPWSQHYEHGLTMISADGIVIEYHGASEISSHCVYRSVAVLLSPPRIDGWTKNSTTTLPWVMSRTLGQSFRELVNLYWNFPRHRHVLQLWLDSVGLWCHDPSDWFPLTDVDDTPAPSRLRHSDDSRGHIQGLARTTTTVLGQHPGHVTAACATHFMKRCRKWLMSLDTETSKIAIPNALRNCRSVSFVPDKSRSQ